MKDHIKSIQVIDRAVAILNTLAVAPNGLGLKVIAQ